MNPNYCSVANPASGCRPIAGIAVPMNATTLEVFKGLQRQLNRVLKLKGKALLSVDGRLGPAVVKAIEFSRTLGSVTNVLLRAILTVDDAAEHASNVSLAIQGLANSLSAPAAVNDPTPTSPPSLPGPNGSVLHPPADQMALAATTGGLSLSNPLVLGAAGVALLLLFGGKKKPAKQGQ